MIFHSACSSSRFIPEDKLLLKGNKLQVEGSHKKELYNDLDKLYKQNPNNRLLFIFNLKPYFYFKGSTGKDNWYKKIQRNALGEPPIFVDTLFIETTIKSMKGYLQSHGYFYSDFSYKVTRSKRKYGKVHYHVALNYQYKIGDVTLQIEDKSIHDLISESMDESLIRQWRGIDQESLLKEQERILNLLRDNGYYQMSKEYVDFDLDTTNMGGYCHLGINIRNPNDTLLHEKFYNAKVNIEIEPNNRQDRGLLIRDSLSDGRLVYKRNQFKLNPEILNSNILLLPGQEFRQQTLNRTYGRLSDLGIFRFVNIQSKPFEKNDSNFINFNIRLIPSVKYSLTFEPQATLSDQNNTLTGQDMRNYGIAFVTQFTNRNIFSNAEILSLNFRSAIEAQGQSKDNVFFNSTEQKLTASIIMPRTLLFSSFDRNEKYYSNKTIFSASAIYEINIDYERQVFITGYNYQLNKKLATFYFWPLELSFIRSQIRSSELLRQSESDIFLQNLFNNNLIVGSRFGFIYSNKSIAKGKSFYYLKWDVLELAGTPITGINALTNQNKTDGYYTVFGVRYSEFAKSTIDFRYNTKLDVNNFTVFRIYAGYALPFGNTPEFVPFEKRYFVGGANDLRGWRPRSIGPGAYNSANQLDYSGEVKLEFNAEYRFNVYHNWLEGAVFTDVGNVWNAKPIATRWNSEFQLNRFYKELAFDAGLGIRLNFEIFLIRFDFALPLHDPSFVLEERWRVKDFSSSWLIDNFNFNFGIGYPF